MPSDTDHLLDVAVRAADAAAEIIRARAHEAATIEWRVKRTADFVSDVDTAAEHRIRDIVAAAFPEAVVVGEELSPDAAAGAELAFVVDPLDGTTNFLHGYRAFAVSIGVLVGGELRAGVVLDVPTGDRFTAHAGGGAFRNGERVRASRTADPGRALVGTGFPFKVLDSLDEYLRQFAAVTRSASGIRRLGSAALDFCDLACGRLDAFWETTLAPWDMAAGILLVREAGGVVTDFAGDALTPKHSSVVAANAPLHEWLLTLLRNA